MHGREVFTSDIFDNVFALSYLDLVDGSKQKFTQSLAYALLSNKKQSTYEPVFKKLRELSTVNGVPTFAPPKWMVDYEMAQINAIRKVFGNDVEISGCYFHYVQVSF